MTKRMKAPDIDARTIRRIRGEQDKTQFAALLGTTAQSLYCWEKRGQRPRPDMRRRLYALAVQRGINMGHITQ